LKVEKARNLIKELCMKHAVEGQGCESAVYERDEIFRMLIENGFSEEEAGKLLGEHEEEIMHTYFKRGGYLIKDPEHIQSNRVLLYEMMDECDLANYCLDILWHKLSETYNEDPQKYIMEGTYDIEDRTEIVIRAIYAEKKTSFLTKHLLIGELIDREKYTGEEAEKVIEKYQKRKVLNYEAPYIDVKQYRLKNANCDTTKLIDAFRYVTVHRGNETKVWIDEDVLLNLLVSLDIPNRQVAKQILTENSKNLETRITSTQREGYRITRLEDLYIGWAIDCETAQREMAEGWKGTKNATRKVQFKDIREIFKQAMKRGKKTLTYKELTEKIAEKCGVNQEEADKAFWSALSNFKIWPEWEKNKDKKWEEKEYWWRGSCDHFPPRPTET